MKTISRFSATLLLLFLCASLNANAADPEQAMSPWTCQLVNARSSGTQIPEPFVFNFCLQYSVDGQVRLGISELMDGRGQLNGPMTPQYRLTAELTSGTQIVNSAVTNANMLFDLSRYGRTPARFTLSGVGSWIAPDGQRIPPLDVTPTSISIVIGGR
ncbi:hypothetical protein FHW67_000462 [Herbaspirillum sp. Sphag1AN]|uniref:hypothetical protein n=1 Tax=unclassified Herbaspirillum TaxID=2624150 RepID=UPI00161CEC2E|nr:MULTISPECIES: hypothetical protein [unclassified Herbaspirillum]MBB3211227.1 hypothetical protein [Herbaspirillum sp. Sphag1AN]MBB3244856.1 hypothetical protein [Herbaspirillum sp. Sphag64]